MYSLNIMYAKKTWFSALTDTTRGSESQLTAGIIAVYYVGDGIRFTLLTVIFWKVECEAVKINHYWLGSKLFLSSLLSFHFVPWENVSCSVATNHSSLPLLLLPFSPSLPPFLSSNERQKAIIKSQKADGCWCLAADDWQLMLGSSCCVLVLQGWGRHLIGASAFEIQVNQLTFTLLLHHKLDVVTNGHSNGCGESSEWRIISIKP